MIRNNIKISLISVLVGLCGLFSCQKDNTGAIKRGGNNGFATMTILLPVQAPKTYAYGIDAYDENLVQSLDLLVFKKDGVNETFLYRSEATGITDLDANGTVKKFTVKITNSVEGGVRLVLLANSRTELDALDLNIGDSKEQILSQLSFSITGSWPVANSGSFVPFPMWGQTPNFVEINEDTDDFPTIKMLRALARVDVGLNFTDLDQDPVGLSNFTLEKVHLFNTADKGQFAPSDDNLFDGKVVAPTMPYPYAIDPSHEYNSTHIKDQKSLVRSIYLAERPAGEESDRNNACFMIIEGCYDGGSPTFYRVDFLRSPGEYETENTYLPILRNHRYVFNIQKVTNQGYPTMLEAMEKPSMNSIQVKQTYYDESIASLTFDGNYLLGLSDDEVRLTYRAYPNLVLKAYTNYPTGYTVTVDKTKYPWVEILSGDQEGPDVFGEIRLSVEENLTDIDRTAEIVFTFGRMSEVVKILQVDDVDENGNMIIIPPTDENLDPTNSGRTFTVGISHYNSGQWTLQDLGEAVYHFPWSLPMSSDTYSMQLYTYLYPSVPYPADSIPPINREYKILPEGTTWLEFNGTISEYDYVSRYESRFNITIYPNDDYTDMNKHREAIIRVTMGHLTFDITIKQDVNRIEVPKGFDYTDEFNNYFQFQNTLLIAPGSLPSNSWYVANNVEDGASSTDDPLSMQVSPARDYSCAKLNELKYMGFTSGWRIPTYQEARGFYEYNQYVDTYSLFRIIQNYIGSFNNSMMTSTTDPKNPGNFFMWESWSKVKTSYNKYNGATVRCVRTSPELD